MRIAILLTGIDELFPKIKDKILSQFECEGIEFDFFCHTWDEIIEEINPMSDDWSDISSKFVKKNIPFPHKDHRLKNHKTTSYQEIYDNYISMDGISHIIRQNRMVFFINYIAQSLSTYNAFNALEEYRIQNEVEYDMVFKWRWDLLFDPNGQDKLNELKEHEKNSIYSTHIDSNQMSDVWWGSDYEIFKTIINDLPRHMAFYISNSLNTSGRFGHEHALLECIKNIATERKLELVFSSGKVFPANTIVRTEPNGDEDFSDMVIYNRRWREKTNNTSWAQRMIKRIDN